MTLPTKARKPVKRASEHDDVDDECSNCGGEGIVYSCDEEFACIDPEGGCDLCARRCDWCQS